MKNSVFGKISEISLHTAQPTFRGEGVGQIDLLPFMCQLTASHGSSHLTFRYHDFFPKYYGIENLEFFNSISPLSPMLSIAQKAATVRIDDLACKKTALHALGSTQMTFQKKLFEESPRRVMLMVYYVGVH